MHPLTRLAAAALAALPIAATVGFPRTSAAAPCGRPDLIGTIPQDGAKNVPTNGTLSARYEITTEYLGEDVVMEHVGVGERVVPARFDEAEQILSVTPAEPWTPGGSYVVRWPRLRSKMAVGLGTAKDVRFTAGREPDRESPIFDGLEAVRWNVERTSSQCADEIKERLVFDLDLSLALDDGGQRSLTLIVFQTAGPAIAAPKAVWVGQLPDGDQRVRVTLALDEAVGRICFAAVTRDLTGRVSGGGEREVCVDTIAPPFFQGCSVGVAPGGPPRTGAPVLLLLGLLLRLRGRAG